ncbi:hypothetical protein CLV58_109118 [Spirosoma oryzae]|uniref:Uncharacterized protein n=1 Tax=Spirosoma oryzae TaxID=1469603 RepID=A0A2T0SY93_9BACT|nr:hypothetical protein [Spirosoma oryzae]PRY38391.1 hypothetical protein CLV58_109118 [Spirosoma oryzae]
MNYTLKRLDNYPDSDDYQEVVWEGFMPFDILKGHDNVPRDTGIKTIRKKHWWVCPRTKSSQWDVQSVSAWIKDIPTKEFKKLDQAVEFCHTWYRAYLQEQLSKL